MLGFLRFRSHSRRSFASRLGDIEPTPGYLTGRPPFRSKENAVISTRLVDAVQADFGPLKHILEFRQRCRMDLLIDLRRKQNPVITISLRDSIDDLGDRRDGVAEIQPLDLIQRGAPRRGNKDDDPLVAGNIAILQQPFVVAVDEFYL